MVSVIITTYKRSPDMLLRAINSVRNQTYTDLEILIVDDSPSEFELRKDVRATVENISDSRIKYIPLERNSGGCIARNRGINEAKGEYITFLDDDDMYLQNKLELQVAALVKKPEAGWVSGYSYSCHIDGAGNILDKKLVKTQAHGGMVFDDLILDNYIPSVSAMVRREVIEKVGGFDEIMPAAQDLDLWLRVAAVSELVVVENPLIYQCIHEGERVTRSPKKKLKAYELIIEKNSEYMESHPVAKAKYVHNQVKYLLWLQQKPEAKKKLLEACNLNPRKKCEYIIRFLYWNMTYGTKTASDV